MTPMTQTRPVRRGLSALGILSLLVAVVIGCVPAPSVTTLPNAPAAGSAPLKVQGVLKAEIEKATLEPSPYHEVTVSEDGYFELYVIAPLSERQSLSGKGLSGLIPDDEDPDRFTQTFNLDDPRVTHVGYYPEWQDNVSSTVVAERGGLVATRVSYDGDYNPRLGFTQPTAGPLTVRSSSREMGIITSVEGETSVHRRLTLSEDLLTPLEGAKDAVIVFTVTNLDGEPINGLTKDQIRFRLYNPEEVWEGEDGYPYDRLEAIADGKYQIREPFSPYEEPGKLRFEVDVVNPRIPLDATFYRR